MNALVDIFIQATKTLGRKMPKIIFKAHPAGDENLKLIKEKIAHYEQLNLAESEDTQTLINHAKAVITINSTVGIESLLKAKPVLILGQAFYNINGLTLSASSNNQFINALSELNNFKPNDKLLNNFLYHLHYKYQIKGNWRQADTEHIKAMSQRIIELSHAA
jgi:capsular polysaccharide export protein